MVLKGTRNLKEDKYSCAFHWPRTCKINALSLAITWGFLCTFKNTVFNNLTDLKSGYLRNQLFLLNTHYSWKELTMNSSKMKSYWLQKVNSFFSEALSYPILRVYPLIAQNCPVFFSCYLGPIYQNKKKKKAFIQYIMLALSRTASHRCRSIQNSETCKIKKYIFYFC